MFWIGFGAGVVAVVVIIGAYIVSHLTSQDFP